ncbi:MAG: tripartite tricarboxylate transporter substrate binding protein [Rubrivivax sp.]
MGRSTTRRRIVGVVLAAALAGASSLSTAEGYPSRPVRVIVPFAPGGTTDAIARIVLQKTGELLGQPAVVENRAGAGGNVGTDVVAKAAPDGYTLAVIGNSFTVNPALYKAMPYRQSDLMPVVLLAQVPFVMVARKDAPYRTMAEMVDYARANPGKVSYASGGNGTIGHLGAHWLSDLAKVQMQHIPYKGGSAAMNDLLGGQVEVFFDTLITSTPHLSSGRIRPLFVTTEARHPGYPEVPTATEAGFPDLTFSAWVGVVAPASTPLDVLGRISTEVNRALSDPDVRQRLAAVGALPTGGTIQRAQQFMARETERWAAVVRSSGAKVD